MLKILAAKMIYGIVVGFAIDALHRFLIQKGILAKRRMLPASTDKKILEEEPGTEHIKDLCEQDNCHCDKGAKGIFKSALIHTLQILLYIFIITLVLNIIMEYGGEALLGSAFTDYPIVQSLIAGAVGLIPNCAASVLITQLYLEGIIGIGAMLSGLMVGAGTGLLILLRSNRGFLKNLKVIGVLYITGVIGGLLIGLIPVW